MNIWSEPTGNGWHAAINDDGTQLVYGTAPQVGWRDCLTGLIRNPSTPGRDTYQGGFGSRDLFLRNTKTNDDGSGFLEWVSGRTSVAIPIGPLPPTSNFQAGPGLHWAASCSGDLIFDNRVIDHGVGRPLALSMSPDGRSALVVNCADGLRYYLDGVRQPNLPRPTDTSIDLFVFEWPYVCLGYTKPYLINVETRAMEYVGCFPAHNESYAVPAAPRVWSAGSANGVKYVCGRVTNAEQGVVIEKAGTTVAARVRYLDGVSVVAVNDRGGLTVYEVPPSAPDAPIPVEVPPPPPPDPKGTVKFSPVMAPSPVTVTGTVTLDADSGPTKQVRFFAQHGSDAVVRWNGPTGNELSAAGLLTTTGAWACWARLQGENDKVVDLPASPVIVTAPVPTRYRGLNAGFGDAISQTRIDEMTAAKYNLVRSSIGATRAPGMALLNVINMDTSLSILRQMTAMEGAIAEAGNEPNLGTAPQPKLTPSQYASLAEVVRERASALGVTVYYGAVSNCNPDGQKYLQDVLTLCPWIERVSIHRYQYGKGQPNPNASPYGSRMQEWASLANILQGRRVLVSETGCPDQHQEKFLFWWRTRPTTEQAQLEYVRAELQYWSTVPTCDGVVLYQEWTGSPETEHYGLRGPDWTRKRAFYSFI